MASNPYHRQNKPRAVKQVERQPSEDAIQIAIMEWLALQPYKDGKLVDFFHHSPNGGVSSFRQKAKFKKMGTLNGFPDLQCFIARGGYHGLFIELKRKKGGVVSADQKRVLAMLNNEGYQAVVCRGLDSAVEAIEEYMRLNDG